MKLAVMQPYLFPYLGYIQLVGAVDTFVFFDDVNFINKGWINRNNILVNGNAYLFTVPLKKASQNKFIHEIEIAGYAGWRDTFLKQVNFNYRKAPHFETIYAWLENVLSDQEFATIGELASRSIVETAKLLMLPTRFEWSSRLQYNTREEMNGQDKVLAICRLAGAGHYINPKNGTELYNKDDFEKLNIRLNFIAMDDIQYPQHSDRTFVPFLSILDVLFFNGVEGTKELVKKFSLN